MRTTILGRVSFKSVCCALFFAVSLAAGDGTVPVKTVVIPYNPDNYTIDSAQSRWDNGFLIQMNRGAKGMPPRVWLKDSSGKVLIGGAEVSLPGAYQISLDSVAAASDGGLEISADVWNSAGNLVNTILHLTREGVVDLVADTGGFRAKRLLVAPSGDIWGLGAGKAGADYSLVKHFNRDGSLIKSFFARSEIVNQGDRVTDLAPGAGMIGRSSASVGVYYPELELWSEFDLDGNLLARFKAPQPAMSGANGSAPVALHAWETLAMLDSGRVYALFGPPASEQPQGVIPQVGLYQLDRLNHKWVFVMKSPSGFNGIYGVEAERIIRRNGCCTYAWFDVPDVVGAPVPR